jgi:hypothetical protein
VVGNREFSRTSREIPAGGTSLQVEAREPSRERMTDENSAVLRGFGCETSLQFHFGFRSVEFWHTTRTTKLYDRTSDELTLDEIERIAI